MKNSVTIKEQGEYSVLLINGHFIVCRKTKGFIQQVSKEYLDEGWAIRKFKQLVNNK